MAGDGSASVYILLQRELDRLSKHPVPGFVFSLVDNDDVFRWHVLVEGPLDTDFEGGLFQAIMTFPKTFPIEPPAVKFTSEMWHPNIHPDGEVNISILHPSGDDPYKYEDFCERWRPVHTPESIMVSIVSLLPSPNAEAAANVDAAKQWREDREGYKKKVWETAQKSLVVFDLG